MDTKDIIKQKRLEKNLTMKKLGELVGVSEATISRWESGNIATMKQTKIGKLCEALNISPNEIVPGIESISSSPTTSPTTPPESQNPYYLDPEVAELADRMKNQPGMRILFDAAKDVSKEDLETVAKMMEALKKTKK